MVNPKCPANIPAKNTNVTPKETPQKRTFPKPKPIAEINDRITTACRAECSTNKLYSQSKIKSIIIYVQRYNKETKVSAIWRKNVVC